MSRRRGLIAVAGILLVATILVHYSGRTWDFDSRGAAGGDPRQPNQGPPSSPSFLAGANADRRTDDRPGKASFASSERHRSHPVQRPYRVLFEGNRSFSAATLRSHLELPLPVPASKVIESRIRAALDNFYQRRGFLDFAILGVEVKAGAPTEILVTLEEGPLYRYDQVVVRKGQDLTHLISGELPSPGQAANLSSLKDAKSRLEGIFRDEGYLDFRLEYMWAKDKQVAEVDLILHLERGQHYAIGEVRGPEPLPSALANLAGRPFSRSFLEPRLLRAGYSWTDIRLLRQNDFSVDIEIGEPSSP